MIEVYFNDRLLNEVFSADIDGDTFALGTFAFYEIWEDEGDVLLDMGDGYTTNFSVVNKSEEILENMGRILTFDIIWD